MSSPIVEVEEGKLKGKVSESLDNIKFVSFKGIPYAKPPIGDLRFSVPIPPEPWEGIRDATKTCNICAQFDKATQTVIGDEDCLYMNIYTPKLPTESSSLLPVMVFIHGGGFLFGDGTDDMRHGPDFLVGKNVVIVSFNYRLGILGFLSLDCKDAPGNMGLRDQVQALKWVQKNIMKFGGDPNNVTIFGVSAGGASVEYLVLSPSAKGLFHKAIAQSGSTLLPWAYNDKIKQLACKMPLLKGKVVHDDKQLLQFLKDLPAKELVSLSMLVLATDSWRGGIYFGFVPTVEKPGDWEPFLDKKPYDLLSQGEFTKVPFVSGFCAREGLLMVSHAAARLEKFYKEKNFLELLPFDIDETDKHDLEAKLKTIYLEGEKKFDEEDAFAIDFFSDIDFFGGGYVSALHMAKHNSSTYFYEFAYDGGLNYLKSNYCITRKGACHGDDGGYLIKCDALLSNPLTQTDLLVRERMVEMWTNFAKFGDPTPKVDGKLITTKWEPIAETGMSYLHIDHELNMKDESTLYPARAKLFKELYEKHFNKQIV